MLDDAICFDLLGQVGLAQAPKLSQGLFKDRGGQMVKRSERRMKHWR